MELLKQIERHGLAKHSAFIQKHALVCIRFSAELVKEESLAVGTSKYGGLPDVPEGFEWPTIQSYPMTHLAQINCSEISRLVKTEKFPSSGMLNFFVQTDEEGYIEIENGDEKTWLVIHNDFDSLQRMELPEDSEFYYNARQLTFRDGLSLPDTYDEPFAGFSETDMESYQELQNELGGHEHQLFGHPAIIQGRRI